MTLLRYDSQIHKFDTNILIFVTFKKPASALYDINIVLHLGEKTSSKSKIFMK